MARGNAALAFAAGLGGGYLTAKDKQDKQARDDQDRQMRQEEHDARMREVQRQDDDRAALANAARPVTVNDNAATVEGVSANPTLYSDAGVAASDVRQANRLASLSSASSAASPSSSDGSALAGTDTGALGAAASGDAAGAAPASTPSLAQAKMTPTLTVQGKQYGDRASADAAAASANNPVARFQRVADAYASTGRPAEALQFQQAAQKAADDLWDRKVRDAVPRGFEGLGRVMTDTEAGPFAGKTVKPVPSADGKSVTFHLVNDDGTTSPTAYTFSNDQNGIIGAAYQMAKVSPELRYENMLKQATNDAKVQKMLGDLANAAEKTRLTGEAERAKLEAARSKAENGDKPPVGYRRTASGNLEAIPGGPADAKQQGQFNQDTAALTGSMSSFDRLATAANEVLNHPGLEGITGWRGKLPNSPGSDAANAEALLGTLKSQVGFGVLQDMRNNSKTGGALGAVSDSEGKRLESNLAALDKSQSLDQFKANLQKIIDYSEQAKDRLRSSYNLRYADRQPQTGGATGSFDTAATKPVALPKSQSALKAGQVYQTSRGPAKWNGKAFEAQ